MTVTAMRPDVVLTNWGVWDKHTRTWLVDPTLTVRDAWICLLEVDSDRPWELELTQSGQVGAAPDRRETCLACGGDGDCPTCRTPESCPDCGGEGKVPA